MATVVSGVVTATGATRGASVVDGAVNAPVSNIPVGIFPSTFSGRKVADTPIQYMTDVGTTWRNKAVAGNAAFKIVGYTLGTGGYLPYDPLRLMPPQTSLTDLRNPIWPSPYTPSAVTDINELANGSIVVTCRIPDDQANYGIGEIGYWAEVTYSTTPSEVGTVFLLAIGQYPIIPKGARIIRGIFS